MRVMLSLAATDLGRSGLSTYVSGLYRAALDEGLLEHLSLLGTAEEIAHCGLPLRDPRVTARRVPDGVAGREASVAWHLLGIGELAARAGADLVHLPVGNRRPGALGPVPVVATVHDLGEYEGARDYGLQRALFARHLMPAGLRAARNLIVISEATRASLATLSPALAERAVVVPNGVELSRFTPGDPAAARAAIQAALGIDTPYLLYPARLEHPAKNHLRLIRGFMALRERESLPHRLVLVGAPWDGAEAILAAVQATQGAVVYPGFVDSALLPSLFRGADALVFPSLFEGFGLPPLEAMACGVPVLASDAASLPEVVGEAGLLVDCRRDESLLAGLARIVQDEGLRQRLRGAGPARAARFTWTHCARRTFEVFRAAGARA